MTDNQSHPAPAPPQGRATGEADDWQFFNWPMIVKEARLRHEGAAKSAAEAITPEMRTPEYWLAWCAHANAVAALRAAPLESGRARIATLERALETAKGILEEIARHRPAADRVELAVMFQNIARAAIASITSKEPTDEV